MNDPSLESNALLNPPWNPGPTWGRAFDILSLALPAVAGLLSIAAGICSLQSAGSYAAVLGILAGVISAFGVIFTSLASRIRDGRIAVAYAVGSHGLDLANSVSDQSAGFGG